MTQVRLGRTGIISDKNGFGALPVQRVTEEEACKILRKAFQAGFTFFDTARSYSDSEKKIGLALLSAESWRGGLTSSDVRSQITLATKTPSTTVEGFWKDLNTSLQLMKTDYIDIFQFHNPSFCPKPGDGTGLYEAMEEARAKGLIRFIGITNHRLHVAKEAVLSGLYDTLQFPFCYLSSEKDIELVKLCEEHNIGFIAMKALSGGLITDSAAAYAWLDLYKNVLPIWGVQREEELDEFISYMKESPVLTDERKSMIEKDRNELAGTFCRGCGYCMPCPAGIEINNCARMSQLIRRSPSAKWLQPEAQEKMNKIDDCIHCNKCSSKCPYGLNTPELLKQHLADYRNILAGNVRI